MELLTSSYVFLNELVMTMESGQSARHIIEKYVASSRSKWSKELAKVFYAYSAGSFNKHLLRQVKNSYERAMLSLIVRSLEGQPILSELKALERQYFKAHEQQLDIHLLRLPYLALVPLFLFLFPSYLILMLGPILKNLLQELSKV